LDSELVRRLKQEAERRALSLNRTVLVLLREALGLGDPDREPAVHEDLDHLAGTWSAREAREAEEGLARHRTVDPDMWK
jgi:hypothetical protein